MKYLVPVSLTFVLTLAGCASTHPLNSPQHVAALTSSFSTACQQAGGLVGKPVTEGSEALCTTQSGTNVDMYINSNFILIHGQSNADLAEKHFQSCKKNGGTLDSKYKIVGNRLVDISGGKTKCTATTWNSSYELVTEGQKKYSRVFVSFPRDTTGAVDKNKWPLAFTFY